jgi:hypothetical protein
MKTTIISSALGLLFALPALAQDRTTVNAMSSEISDNLDLRAVASIFGDSKNLEDFERRLNDPNSQISNLDLNNDNRVDYLRVIETVEANMHLVVVQSVLGLDTFQDVATIEVERDRNNQVSVQVVGDVYMYGANYIYEPVYVHTPVIFTSFWVSHYRPYCSTWYWGYYPTYYYAWTPFPVFRYRNNIHVHINFSNHYNYVTVRRNPAIYAMYAPRRANYCETRYPTRSFAYRNNNVRNRYELDQTRNIRNVSTRNGVAYGNSATNVRNNATRNENIRLNNNAIRANENTRAEANTRNNPMTTRDNNAVRNNGTRSESNPVRNNGNVRSDANVQNNAPIRSNENTRSETRSNPNPVRTFNNPRTENSVRMNPNIGRNENRGNGGNRMESQRMGNQNRVSAPQPNMQRQAGNAPNQRNNGDRGGRR